MKPLKRGRCGSNAYAPKALEHHASERDESSGLPKGSFEEHVFVTANLGGAK
jgi:hypothetical protein